MFWVSTVGLPSKRSCRTEISKQQKTSSHLRRPPVDASHNGIPYIVLPIPTRTTTVTSLCVPVIAAILGIMSSFGTMVMVIVVVQEFSYGPVVWAPYLAPNIYLSYTIFKTGADRRDPTRIKGSHTKGP